MTSENQVENIPTIEITETNHKPDDEQEPTVLTNNPVEESVVQKTEADEGEEVHKPKRGGRKKREITAVSDVKAEHLNNEQETDTQPLFEQPVILEGKRSRKPTSRLELSDLETPKKEFSIPQGRGKPLGEIAYINHQLTYASTDALSHIRNVCFGRRGSKTNIQQTLREFNGFEFDKDSDEYQRHLNNINKLKKDQLQSMSEILGLPTAGSHNENAERILVFLMNPIDEGKPIPERKTSMRVAKTSRIYSKESIHSDEEENDNGDGDDDDDDDDADVVFNEDDEEGNESDDDYIGSDEESGMITKDDPDDFAYQPGKKTPKKRTSLKRSRSGSSQKRKRASPRTTKRGRKRTKVTPVSKVENEDLVSAVAAADDDDQPMQTNDEETVKTKEENSSIEPQNNDVILNQSEQNDSSTTTTTTTTNDPTLDINVISTTS